LLFEGGETVAGDAVIRRLTGCIPSSAMSLFGGDRPRFFGMISWRGG